jgi:putative addiction module component (TIGR02574 family)
MTQMQISELPLAEKIELMESLWESICHESSVTQAIPDWHQAVLGERVARLDRGEDPVAAWEDAKARIREQAGKV